MAGSLIQELKRRNVFRVAIIYIVVSWLLMQIGDVMFPALRLPEWTTTLLVAFLILGFPVAVIFAWAFELTPDGVDSHHRGSCGTVDYGRHRPEDQLHDHWRPGRCGRLLAGEGFPADG